MISPTTSSSIAAVVKIVPIFVVVRSVVLNTVKVVPKLVEQRAAPAAKAWSGVAFAMASNEKENAMGRHIPVIATLIDMPKFALTAENDVETPPASSQSLHQL